MISLAARFGSNLLLVVVGAVLACLALALGPAPTGWVALGVGCLAIVTVLAAFAVPRRGAAQRALDVVTVASAAWTVVAARVLSGASVRWLSFAEGAALVGLGCVGLVLHQAQVAAALRTAQQRSPDRGEPRYVRAGSSPAPSDTTARPV